MNYILKRNIYGNVKIYAIIYAIKIYTIKIYILYFHLVFEDETKFPKMVQSNKVDGDLHGKLQDNGLLQ